MTELTIIRKTIPEAHHLPAVILIADRATLRKRRWRGVAENGREFGFDLEEPLAHEDTFFAEGTTYYVVVQAEEEVLEIIFTDLERAARIAWNLGNLHFGIQITPNAVRVAEDPAVLQLISREHFDFKRVRCVFLPLSAGAHTHHADHHHG